MTPCFCWAKVDFGLLRNDAVGYEWGFAGLVGDSLDDDLA